MAEIEKRSVEPVPSQQIDPMLYRMVVGALALTLLLTVIGGLILSALKIEVPAALIALGASAGGGLAGLLAPSPAQ